MDKQGQFKAWHQPIAYIKAMFHRHSVEHKSTAIGTATNVPRECSTEQGKPNHKPSARFKHHIQTIVYIAGIAHMNTVRLNTRTGTGGGDCDFTTCNNKHRKGCQTKTEQLAFAVFYFHLYTNEVLCNNLS